MKRNTAGFAGMGIACAALWALFMGMAAQAVAASAAAPAAIEAGAGDAPQGNEDKEADNRPRVKHMDPTDAAFAALLSMPGAEPESGEWHFSVPDEYHGKTEQDLIRWLERKKRDGADFNAYRHFGTLLHHALRARLQDTALWLLKHGADPRLPVKDSGQDALSLALERQQARVAEVLQAAPYRMTPPAPQAPAQPEVANNAAPQEPVTPAKARQVIASLCTLHNLDLSMLGYANVLASERAELARLPAAMVGAALDDDETLQCWVRSIATLAPKDFGEFLQKAPQPVLQTRAAAALRGMTQRTRVNFAQGGREDKNSVTPANWMLLLARLPKSLDSSAYPALLPHIGTAYWPQLFARGYRIRNAGDDLGPWLAEAKPEELKQLWPQITAQAPALRQDAIRIMLKNYTPDGTADCRWDWTSIQPPVAEKARFLIAQGVEKPALELNAECMRHSKPEVIQDLLSLQVIKPIQPSTTHGFAADTTPPRCRFALNDAWYQALVRQSASADGIDVSGVQLIDFPGEAECALLVSGIRPGSMDYGGAHDGFNGPEEDPVPSCPDPPETAQTWRLTREGKIEKSEADPNMVGMLRDKADGHRYWLGMTEQGRCSAASAYLLDWRNVRGQWMLTALEQNHPAWQAFVQQYDPSSLGEGPEFKQLFPDAGEARQAADPKRIGSLQAFVDAYRPEERAAYLKAVEALDKPALKAMEAHGIPSWWTREALLAVSKSSQPLPEKRRRMAWLFKNHDQLRKAMSLDVISSLEQWLPAEDWWPVQEVWPGAGPRDARHACDRDHALGLICGETWSTQMGRGGR